MKKRFFSLLLAVLMVISIMPVSVIPVFAEPHEHSKGTTLMHKDNAYWFACADNDCPLNTAEEYVAAFADANTGAALKESLSYREISITLLEEPMDMLMTITTTPVMNYRYALFRCETVNGVYTLGSNIVKAEKKTVTLQDSDPFQQDNTMYFYKFVESADENVTVDDDLVIPITPVPVEIKLKKSDESITTYTKWCTSFEEAVAYVYPLSNGQELQSKTVTLRTPVTTAITEIDNALTIDLNGNSLSMTAGEVEVSVPITVKNSGIKENVIVECNKLNLKDNITLGDYVTLKAEDIVTKNADAEKNKTKEELLDGKQAVSIIYNATSKFELKKNDVYDQAKLIDSTEVAPEYNNHSYVGTMLYKTHRNDPAIYYYDAVLFQSATGDRCITDDNSTDEWLKYKTYEFKYVLESKPTTNGGKGSYNASLVDYTGDNAYNYFDVNQEVNFANWYLRTMCQYQDAGNGNLKVRFISMLGGATNTDIELGGLEQYYKAGFSINGKNIETLVGYTSFLSNGTTVDIGEYSSAGDYFFMVNAEVSSSYDTSITVQPYVTLMNPDAKTESDMNVTFTGQTFTFTVRDMINGAK